ncbi:MAG: T9SS type A sorting domain-containing protein [Bacteroidia bacterium]
MRNKYTLCYLALICIFYSGMAQKNYSLAPKHATTCDAAPSLALQKLMPTPATPQSLFNVQFNYNATDTVGRTGMAGVVFTGTEFWVSRWADDTLYRFSSAGSVIDTFTIPGVTGIRGMTWDGSFVYAGINTSSIKKINPTTRTLVSSITVAAGTAVRHITYDSTANGGAGGFWVGNFSTAITKISMTGATLATITAATHGLTGMYGSAIDHWTAGGPYLWVFDQGGSSQSQIVRLQLPSGTPTGVIHDVMSDVGAGGTSGLAGGLFITNKLNSTARTIVGLIQGTPKNRLFGYELNDFILPSLDAVMDSIKPISPYVMIPITHYTSPLNWKGSVSNQGAATITSGNLVVKVYESGTQVYSNSSPFSNLASFTSFSATTSAGLAASIQSVFNVVAYAQTNAPQTDVVNSNDTLKYSYAVTDTIMARETGITTGSLGIGNGTGGTLGQIFTTAVNDKISSVTFHLNGPTMGDSVSVDIYSYAGQPNAVIASTKKYYITAADTNGVTLTLPLIGGHYYIAPGTYFVGVNEFGNNITLATTDFNYRPNSGWVIFGTNPWTQVENYNFLKTFYLRLNLEGTFYTGISDAVAGSGFNLYPNPAESAITVELARKENENVTVKLLNALGAIVYTGQINAMQAMHFNIDVASYPAGVYYMQLSSGQFSEVRKITIAK